MTRSARRGMSAEEAPKAEKGGWMRILHTADWHLGRVFQQVSLLDDQAALLDQILEHVRTEKPDLLIIAGDIFDRANPRREVIDLFARFLRRFHAQSPAALAVIAGNHDSPELIDFGGVLPDPSRTRIAGMLAGSEAPLLLTDEHGPVAISLLPYAEIFAARQYFGHDEAAPLRTPEDVLRTQIEQARFACPDNARWVIVAHAFVQGGRNSSSERTLDPVGGIETVPADAFSGAHYVALGHLHRMQAVGAPHIRYSGSIMRYGFDEVDIDKSMTLVELDGAGEVTCSFLPLKAPRNLRVIEGLFDDVLPGGADDDNREDFIKFHLYDRVVVPDAMNRLREIYPNGVQIEWVMQQPATTPGNGPQRKPGHRQPRALVQDFLADVLDTPLDNDMTKTFEQVAAVLNQEKA